MAVVRVERVRVHCIDAFVSRDGFSSVSESHCGDRRPHH